MFDAHTQAILEICRDHKLLGEQALQDLQNEHRLTGKALAALIVDQNMVPKAEFLRKIADSLVLEYVDSVPASISGVIIANLSAHHARTYGVVPYRVDSQSIDLLAIDPFNAQIIDDLTFALGKDVRLVVADPERVETLLDNHYAEDDSSLDDILGELGGDTPAAASSDDLDANDLEALAGQAPIIRFVNLVLAQAIRDKASDIHFEPFEHEFKIR